MNKLIQITIVVFLITVGFASAECTGSTCEYDITALPFEYDEYVVVNFETHLIGQTIQLTYSEWLSGTDAHIVQNANYTFITHINIPANVSVGTYDKTMFIENGTILFKFNILDGVNVTPNTNETAPEYCDIKNYPNSSLVTDTDYDNWMNVCKVNLSRTIEFFKEEQNFAEIMNMSANEFRDWWEEQPNKTQCSPCAACVCQSNCSSVEVQYEGYVRGYWKWVCIILIIILVAGIVLKLFDNTSTWG